MKVKKKQVTGRVVIMFADISGSTAIYDKLGDEMALLVITRTLDTLVQAATAHNGLLIKTIGDEILCTFQNATDAFNAACAMQMATEIQPLGELLPVYIRIGIHHGDVIQESDDIYGDAVNVAARITAITRPRQIMTTQAFVDLLPPELGRLARPLKSASFRGKMKSIDVFHLLWEPENTTVSGIAMLEQMQPANQPTELILRHNNKVVTVSDKMKSVELGRGETCDFVIQHNLASRQHASIEYSFGKFTLTDHSANGTYIRFNDNQEVLMNHQQVVLHRAGKISLGQPFSEAPNAVVEYILR
ncbi:MAG: adenylate/guanylate cyclase domain-containing protein [Pseudomonadota bacterium]